jgi:hypothetical protein
MEHNRTAQTVMQYKPAGYRGCRMTQKKMEGFVLRCDRPEDHFADGNILNS